MAFSFAIYSGATGIDLRGENEAAGRGFSLAPQKTREKIEANDQLALAA